MGFFDSQSSTKPTYPGFVKKQLRNISHKSRDLYDSPLTAMIPDLDKWTLQGITRRAEIAGSPNSVARAGSDEAQRTLSGQYLDLSNNPAFQRNIGAAMGAASDRFAGSGRVGSGAYAGALGDAATGVTAQMYNAERQRQMGALGMMPQLIGANYADASSMEDAGRSVDENNMARFDWPYGRLDRYANTIYGNPASQNPGQNSTQKMNWGSAVLGLLSPTGLAGGAMI
jgi:hypothetical protein